MHARTLVVVAAIAGVTAPIASVIVHSARGAAPRTPRVASLSTPRLCATAVAMAARSNACWRSINAPDDARLLMSLQNLERRRSREATAICAAWLARDPQWPNECEPPPPPDARAAARAYLDGWDGHVKAIATGDSEVDDVLRSRTDARDAECDRADRGACEAVFTIWKCGALAGPEPLASEPWLAAIDADCDRCRARFAARCATED